VKADDGFVLMGFLTLLTINENAVLALIVLLNVSVTINNEVLSLLHDTDEMEVEVEPTLQDKELSSGRETSSGNLI
jgi:hypothetical protein